MIKMYSIPKLFVFTYNSKCYRLKNHMIPIEVGAYGRKKFIYSCHDDIGENISELNSCFGELTGIYWVWKNEKMAPDAIIGFAHYNKQLSISVKKVVKELVNNDFIVSKAEKIRSHAIENEYKIFEQEMQRINPDYYMTYKEIIDDSGSGIISGGNLFYTKKKIFDDYCSIIFPILFATYKKIGIPNTTPYYKRYCAFFSERMLSTYIKYRRLSVKEYKIIILGSFCWYITQFIVRVLNKIFPTLHLAEKYSRMLRNCGYRA